MNTRPAQPSLRVLHEAHFGCCDRVHSPSAPPELQAGCAVVVCTRDRPDLLAGFLDSLAVQELHPEQLVIVDASADGRSADVLAHHPARDTMARCIRYCRVDPAAASLTRQRSLALTMVATERLASFDDDIVLLPGCLAAMNFALAGRADVVGVAASMDNAPSTVPWRWRLRRLLLVVPNLEPGRYFASGVSTPWRYTPPGDALDRGDWLPGGAVIWRTEIVRAVGYPEHFDGYGSGEDLAFSLCMRRFG
ncbi:MAG TPA: glycosyltransferase family A protein, partial [Gemmatimonadales bacterium]|nr:glycosyltransferase family A protein [Gemmatimonadales bacterium]